MFIIMFHLDDTYYVHAQWFQSCQTLCDPMDWSPPGCSVCGISHARILARVAISSSRGSSWPRDWTQASCTAGRFFTPEPPGKPMCLLTFSLFYLWISQLLSPIFTLDQFILFIYILDTRPLLAMWFVFSQTTGCLFNLLTLSLVEWKYLILIKSNLLIFFFF